MIMPNGPGVVQCKFTLKLFIPNTSTKSLKIHTLTIGANTNGIKNTGFNTSGAPNKIGLFIHQRMLVQLMHVQSLCFV